MQITFIYIYYFHPLKERIKRENVSQRRINKMSAKIYSTKKKDINMETKQILRYEGKKIMED